MRIQGYEKSGSYNAVITNARRMRDFTYPSHIGALPRLSSLSLREQRAQPVWGSPIPAEPSNFPSFIGADHLSSLTLHSNLFWHVELLLPWATLNSLTITDWSAHHLHFILTHCENLIELRLVNINWVHAIPIFDSVPVTTHLCLQKLYLCNCSPSLLFSLLHAPNVRELDVHEIDFDDLPFHELWRNGLALDSLNYVQSISRALPSIETLRLSFVRGSLEIMPRILSPFLSFYLFELLEKCKGIRHLRLAFQDTYIIEDTRLLRMVKERMTLTGDATARLLSFHVEGNLSAVHEIRELQKLGFAVSGLDECDKIRAEMKRVQARDRRTGRWRNLLFWKNV
ncbi:hypothetical protein D9757_008384 [Collybiopsis confluens]|uniref:Uncharacterized protein n=1 Tax=Collybiopsis confluens TaxID=2823264 RepID=A0A8H5HHH4_9AGAR|nr:hypothetical protein D9757_008384 [Collybiopsis confluens]